MKKIIDNYYKLRRFLSIGISFFDWYKYSHLDKIGDYQVKFRGSIFRFSNPLWFFHNLEEIFLEKVYYFYSESSNPTILDCGANFGLSILYFKKLYPECRIIGFEPDPKVFKLLNRNLRDYNFSNIDLINAAIWDSDSGIKFLQEGSLGGRVISKDNLESLDKLFTIDVETVALKEYVVRQSIDFLKIDIEGSELVVIKSLNGFMSNVKLMFVEYHSFSNQDQKLDEILHIITSNGFRYYIKEAFNNSRLPFLNNQKNFLYDLQLNIFCFRN